jgi:hypothetical protein
MDYFLNLEFPIDVELFKEIMTDFLLFQKSYYVLTEEI